VSAVGERAPEPPQVYTKIHMRYEVTGHAVERDAVQRAVELSQEKYCSVFAMLRHTASTSYEIVLQEAAP
ncbi:MAG TPA: OsmC family protein, partial [Terriglobales bacterium]|nr:OsmC family protein [Terriglobales bacterium]